MISRPVLQDYQALAERVRTKLVNTGGINEVVQVGEVAAPGISDLDLYIFYEPGFSKKDTFDSILEIRQTTNIELDIKFIPVEVREYLHWLLPISTESSLVEQLPLETRRHLAYVYLIVLMPEKLRRLRLLLTRQVPSNIGLRHLYSLKYTMQQLALLNSLNAAEVSTIAEEIQNLRLDWIAGNSCHPQFNELVKKVYTIVLCGLADLEFGDFQCSDEGHVRIMFDWCTLMDFGHYPEFKVAHLPGARIMPEQYDFVIPCHLQASYQWGAILGYFYRHPKFVDLLPPVQGTLSRHVVPSENIIKLVDIYAQIQDSHYSNGLAAGLMFRAICRKDNYKFLSAYRLGCSILAQLFIQKHE